MPDIMHDEGFVVDEHFAALRRRESEKFLCVNCGFLGTPNHNGKCLVCQSDVLVSEEKAFGAQYDAT
jgi:uncharacterized paraquat-inducible protein A